MIRTSGRRSGVKLALKLLGYNLAVLIVAILLLSAIGAGVGPVELVIWLVLVVAACASVTIVALRSRPSLSG